MFQFLRGRPWGCVLLTHATMRRIVAVSARMVHAVAANDQTRARGMWWCGHGFCLCLCDQDDCNDVIPTPCMSGPSYVMICASYVLCVRIRGVWLRYPGIGILRPWAKGRLYLTSEVVDETRSCIHAFYITAVCIRIHVLSTSCDCSWSC